MAENEKLRAYVLIPKEDDIPDDWEKIFDPKIDGGQFLKDFKDEYKEVYWLAEVGENYKIVAGVIVDDEAALNNLLMKFNRLMGASSASSLIITRFARLIGHDNGP